MIRTGYSFRTAFGHLPDVVARLKAIGATCAPIVDRNSTFGYVRWTKLCKEADLRPVYGVELGVGAVTNVKRPTLDYWQFLAIGSIEPIHEILERATENKEPSLLYQAAQDAPGLVRIAGPRANLEHVDPTRVYMGLSPALPRGLYRQAQERGFRFVAKANNVYPTEDQRELYRIALGFRADAQSYPQHILSDDEWQTAMDWVDPMVRLAALQNRDRILAESTAQLARATMLVPQRPTTLRAMCEAGAERLGINLKDQVYADRMTRELDLIQEKQFEDYFYIVAELVTFARERMIVGPARGSSAGSLVCYLLGITAIDPIPHGLLFERFVDVTRSDLPDIDIDFSDQNRQQVFDHAEEIYGAERVARLGTVNMFGPRSIFRQIAVPLRLPEWRINPVLDSLIARSSGDTRAMQQLEDTLKDTDAGKALLAEHPEVMLAAKMEGHPTTSSQHAAGIVITEQAVRRTVAVDRRTKSTMCDKKDAQELNLLKIDALGLKQLNVFERTLELIGQPPQSVHGFLERLPLDDDAAFAVLRRRHFAGIFQFTGITLQSLTRGITVERFEDLVAITALARPGPMATGGATTWTKRRAGTERVTYPHPLLKPYMEETLGVITYQEQVMKIGRELGDLSWKDVTALRKAMSQSLGQEYFDQFGVRWKAGAIAKGIPPELVDKIWFDLCAFGSWGFNKSHAVAYGLVSYWCCWLKAHHPLEFAAATLDTEEDEDRQIILLRELKEEGISYVPVDPAHSEARWLPQGTNKLLGPLTNIPGIAGKYAHEIVSARRLGRPLRPALAKKLTNPKTLIDSLYPVQDRINALHPGHKPTVPIAAIKMDTYNFVASGVLRKMNPRDENEDVNVARRGGRRVTGPDKSLLMFLRDDTDEIFCKIDRYLYEQLGRAIQERGRTGKALYAIQGDCPPDFRMIKVRNVKYLGDMDPDHSVMQAAE